MHFLNHNYLSKLYELNLLKYFYFKVPPKYEDIHFKSVDTLPPKFGNVKTILNDNDNLVSYFCQLFYSKVWIALTG
jgi:hypothetical protein